MNTDGNVIPRPLTLDWLNAAAPGPALAALDGLYEHSPWIAAAALQQRPFASLAQLKHALVGIVRTSGRDAQLALVRAHPELAGKAAVAGALTAESTHEQAAAGLNHCTPEEFAQVQRLNAAYGERFGWPFVMAVRGARGTGLHRRQIIATLERRLQGHPELELAECLRQIDRIAEIRLNDKFGITPVLGDQVWDWAERLAVHTDPGYGERGELTVTYLTEAHRACAAQLQAWMRDDCGFDEVRIDAVGNVVGVYHGGPIDDKQRPRRLLTGSHYDTVRNGGKYDGRLGILVPMACVRELHRAGRRLPFGLEVIGFAEEEGQRYKATFLGSGAVIGHFDPTWLDQQDADGVTMRAAMQAAGLPATLEAIAAEARDVARYLGFVEVHIEQGPVLNELDLPLGVVSSINGSLRYLGEVSGVASHAGTTPMNRRRDAATAVAELALYVEQRAAAAPHLVGTVGMLEVPNGSINVVPGRCRFSLDIRSTTNEVRDAMAADVRDRLAAICERRGLAYHLEETVRAAAAPSDAAWQRRWEAAVAATGLPVHHLPSGAGHDAMKLHEVMPQAMLFVRGENAGISHNPLESTTADDMQLAVEAFMHLLGTLSHDTP
ncbi:2-oxo-4-hydroxy-4-carboxy-5-ureidoimidazoline decarboxylase [Methylibium sp. Root1272]|uniref:2-oxo-4-hydroxy-4-carboxy-5-ureidoimidazoline decarboxylase n=1 Tax=Methylibium sp. Root1272 TaxID=1736441 RepID=UPI0006F570E0|nr:2-oxo-4-hydroxy-4-carboxy-5-ureidoimidazoline decarboxylase [Methylibium sp. Root1272]KQW65374.1 allantoate amidohydrolase [Methylibium sp. Root1272]